MGAVKDVGQALGMQIKKSRVDAYLKIGKKSENAGLPAIIIKFVQRIDAKTMLAKRREKWQLSTRHLNKPNDTPIYIIKSLTQNKRILLRGALAVKREKDYKWVWVRSVKVYMRNEDQSPVKNVVQYLCHQIIMQDVWLHYSHHFHIFISLITKASEDRQVLWSITSSVKEDGVKVHCKCLCNVSISLNNFTYIIWFLEFIWKSLSLLTLLWFLEFLIKSRNFLTSLLMLFSRLFK